MSRFRKRTRLFIVKGFQTRYISLILLCVFATAILSGYTVYFTTWDMFGEKLAAVYPQGRLLDIVKKVNMVLFLRLVFLTPMIILAALVVSNRIAGPVYRIQRYISKVTGGNYKNRLKLRKKDEFKDVAASLNDFVARLRLEQTVRDEKVGNLKRGAEELKEALAAGADCDAKLRTRILGLREDIDSLG